MGIIKKVRSMYRALSLLAESHQTHINLPKLKSIEPLYEKYQRVRSGENTKSLDLGCGAKPRNQFRAETSFGLDVRDDLAMGIKSADLVLDPIPFEDNFFDYVTAYDFLEHIPRVVYLPERKLPFVELMNEIYRVLKPGGIFLSRTPIYPYGSAFRDPTHINILTDETFSLYFDDQHRWAQIYGFHGAFKVLEQVRIEPSLVAVLQKV
jgi:SAM-dependent methyltransferase